ncbi:MAG: FliM/FliN family flagellar motor switch protein [Cyanobacteria bacterium SIG32]|nr:FliM/FliN family flagellar motor switch protein [Cyanobacteria bacterium SIG32]
MSTQTINSIDSKELYTQYNWYRNTFKPIVQKACDEFFLPGFRFEMLGISKNITPLTDKDSYFVTKIRIDKQYDMFFRSSEGAIALILEKILGKPNRTFNLNKMTDLEAKIITTFNDYMFGMVSEFLSPAPAGELRRTNFDVIHLTFIIKDEENNKFGKFIVSLPDALLNPESVVSSGDKFENTTFSTSTLDVKIKIGSTRFSMHDLKNLDTEDMVIFDNSNIKKLTLAIGDYEKEIKLNPNLGLITPIEDNDGGDNMGANNLWDSIEVEMNAEFDAVRITLGELKKIEDGMVVDLTSIYNNKVTLRVEDKAIARGELVIVNDRYGVKIDEVIAQKAPIEPQAVANNNVADDFGTPENNNVPVDNSTPEATSTEDEFDYSDFELDDEDI